MTSNNNQTQFKSHWIKHYLHASHIFWNCRADIWTAWYPSSICTLTKVLSSSFKWKIYTRQPLQTIGNGWRLSTDLYIIWKLLFFHPIEILDSTIGQSHCKQQKKNIVCACLKVIADEWIYSLVCLGNFPVHSKYYIT